MIQAFVRWRSGAGQRRHGCWSALLPQSRNSTSCLVGMSKQQTGLRIERVLFKQFQQLCAVEKLRPGEAVENFLMLDQKIEVSVTNLESIFATGPRCRVVFDPPIVTGDSGAVAEQKTRTSSGLARLLSQHQIICPRIHEISSN